MDAQKVDAFIMANGKFFPDYQVAAIRDMLLAADDSKWSMLQVMQFKDPTICLIISLFAGSLGIDRFFIGDTGLGIAKLITCGGFGIWTIVDWFLIMGAARDKNMETRSHTDGFRRNNANYWNKREICRFYLYSSIIWFCPVLEELGK